jgi:hypothetical protein
VIFQGTIETIITCDNLRKSFHHAENFTDLSLPIAPAFKSKVKKQDSGYSTPQSRSTSPDDNSDELITKISNIYANLHPAVPYSGLNPTGDAVANLKKEAEEEQQEKNEELRYYRYDFCTHLLTTLIL